VELCIQHIPLITHEQSNVFWDELKAVCQP